LYTCKVKEKEYILINTLKSGGVTTVWTGLNDINEEGVYTWVEDNSVIDDNWNFWGPGNPDNSGDIEDCVEYHLRFNDHICATSEYYLCEMTPQRL
ncbi:unnamed protein product, partial [Lymnaea stagnalis]